MADSSSEPQSDARADDSRKSVYFLLLTFALTWSMWLPVAMASRDWFDLGAAHDPLWMLGGFGPSVAAFVLVARAGGWNATRRFGAKLLMWRASAEAYAGALLLVPALAILALGLHVALGGDVPTGANLDVWYLLPGMFIAALLLGPISEEFGWRGYLLPRMQRVMGAVGASLAIGLIWALWHAPLFLMTGVVQEGSSFLLFAALGVAFTIYFTWLHNRTSGSVLFAVLLHASINSTFWLVPAPADTRLHFIFFGLATAFAIVLIARGSLAPGPIDSEAHL
jgi:uncharacterized protein